MQNKALPDDFFDDIPIKNDVSRETIVSDKSLPEDFFSDESRQSQSSYFDKAKKYLSNQFLPDIAQGLGQTGADIGNFLLNPLLGEQLVKTPRGIDVKAANIIEAPKFKQTPNTTIDELIQGAAGFAPFALGGELLAPAKVESMAPFLQKYASMVPRLASEGATYGLVSDQQNPLSGATVGALSNVAGYPIGAAVSGALGGGVNMLGAIGNQLAKLFTGKKPFVGGENISNTIKNKILDFVESEAKKGGANLPEQAKENLTKNFLDKEGNPLPVDLGSIANHSALSNIYQALKYAPFSRVTEYNNKINDALLNKDIEKTQGLLNQVKSTNNAAPFKQELDKNQQRLNLLSQHLNDLMENKKALEGEIYTAPNYLRSLSEGVPQGKAPSEHILDSLRNSFQNIKSQAEEKYAPINEQENLDLSKFKDAVLFPNFQKKAQEILENKEQLKNIFGDDSDMGTLFNKEMKKITYPLSKDAEVTPKLGFVRDRIQNIMKLASAAKARGDREQAMELGGLGQTLKDDLDDLLRRNNKEDLADNIQEATNFYRDNVIPYYGNKQIRNVVQNKNYIPPSIYDVVKELHLPQNNVIINSLPKEAQLASAQRLIMGKGGNVQEIPNLTPEKIVSRWNSNILTPEIKRNIISYAPEINENFDKLSQSLVDYNNLKDRYFDVNQMHDKAQKHISLLQKNIDKVESGNKKEIDKLATALEELKNKKLTSKKSSGIGETIAKSGLGISPFLGLHVSSVPAAPLAIAAGIGAKNLAKALRDPELIQKYINKERFPVKENIMTSATSPVLTRLGVPIYEAEKEENK